MLCTDCVPDTGKCNACVEYAEINPTSGECECITNRFQTENRCELCHYSCAKCAMKGEDQCTKCFANYGIFGVPIGKCLKCYVNCYHCYSQLSITCTACYPLAEMDGPLEGRCACVPGAYTETDATQCVACHSTCATCTHGTASDCLSCSANASLQAGACVCNNGFARSTADCLPCHASCLTCTLPNDPLQCLTCKSVATVASAPGPCVCPSNYFPDPTSEKCTLCALECATCAGALSTQCTTCFPNAHLVSSPGPCQCDSFFFPHPDVTSCSPCDSSCATCEQATACLTCVPPAAIFPSTLLCVCGEQIYPTPTPRNCQSCSSLCRTCVDATSCLSCWSNAHISAGACLCDDGFYPSPDAANCAACHSMCKACSGGNDSSCLSCGTNAHLSGAKCVCDNGFYFPLGTSDCSACHSTCATCKEGGSGSCTSCWAHAGVASVVGYGACVCLDGYFPSSTAANCSGCSTTCRTCSGSASTCTSCKSPAALSGPTCVCEDGYYGSADNCQPCHGACLTCSGPLASDCLSCPSSIRGCNLSNPQQCMYCDPKCSECSGRTSSQCTGCLANAEVVNGTCTCVSGFYPDPDASSCSPCHSSCSTCVGGAADQCLTCSSQATLVSGSSPGACGCQLGYFADPTPASCSNCDACLPCASVVPTLCLPCCASSTGDGSTPTCDVGFYPSNTLAACNLCYLTCKTCNEGTATDCLSCFPNATLQGAPTGACTCNLHYFPNTAANNCTSCDPTCYSCTGTSATSCKTCYGAAILSLGACICDLGYYTATTSADCQLCDVTCRGCSGSGPILCTSCKEFATLTSGACVCSDGYYMDAAGVCQMCNTNCKTCIGTATTCLSCYDGLWVDSSACVPCVNNCATCLSATHCYTCVALTVQVGTSCLSCTFPCATCSHGSQTYCDSCSNGYYLSISSCPPCASECTLCSGTATNCSACAPGYMLLGGNTCAVCLSPCATCVTTSKTCLSCVPGYALQAASCLPCEYPCVTCTGTPKDCLTCPDGFCLVGVRCVLCNSPCATCTGTPDLCLSCVSGFLLSGNSCPPCPVPCRTCTVSDCLSCIDGYFMNGGVCTPCVLPCKACYRTASTCLSCVDTYYLEGTTCKSCPTACGGCSDPSTCLSCPSGFVLVGTKCVVYCPHTCATCSRADPDFCTSCKAHAHPLGAFPAACLCDSGYYMDAMQWDCHLCHQSCSACTTASPLRCAECVGAFSMGMLYCEDYCPLNYYQEAGNCVSTVDNALVFQLTFSSVKTPYVDSIARYICEVSPSAPFVAYQKGLQLSGSQYVRLPSNSLDPRDVTLPSSFFVELWVRPRSDSGLQCMLAKSIEDTELLSVCLLDGILQLHALLYSDSTVEIGTNQRLFESALAKSSVLLGGPVAHAWTDVVVTVEASKPALLFETTLSIFVDGVLRAQSLIKEVFFRDFSSVDGAVAMLLGAKARTMAGFEGAIAELALGVGLRTLSSCSCALCTTSGLCLSPCGALEYGSACSPCESSCAHGCMRGGDCVLTTDPLCASASDFNACTACRQLSVLTSGVCQCIPNASVVSSACQCAADFQESNGVCEPCADFVSAANLNPAGTLLTIDFSKSMEATALVQCASIFPAATLGKLGASPSCVWLTAARLQVVLGTGRTLKAEAIQLNQALRTRTDSCLSSSPVLATVKFTPEKPVAVITASQTFSLACGELLLSGLSSTGADLSFTWTLRGAGLLPRTLTGEELTIAREELSEGTLTATLTARNYSGLESSAEASVRITSKPELSLSVGGGESVTMRSDETREFIVSVVNDCGNSAESYSFVWTFVEAQPALPPSVSIPSLLATARSNTLLVASGTLRPGVTYLLRCTATAGSVSGSVVLRVTVLSSDLQVVCDRSDGPLSTATALRIDCSATTDWNDPEPVSARWTLRQSPAEPSTALEFSDWHLVLSLPPNVLRAEVTYSFILMVRKGNRSAQKSISFKTIAADSLQVVNRFVQTRVSSGRLLKVIPEVLSTVELSPSWSWNGAFTLDFCSSTTLPFVCVLPRAEGFGYNLQLSLSAQIALQLQFQVNLSPHNGRFAVSPAAGNAEESYRLHTSGWEDADGPDLPFLYSFGYTDSILFVLPQVGPSFTTRLRAGAYSVVAKVCDSLDSCATATAPVSISATRRKLSSPQFIDLFSSLVRVPQQTISACTTLLATYEVQSSAWSFVLVRIADFADSVRQMNNNRLQAVLSCYTQLAQSQSCDFTSMSTRLLDTVRSMSEELQEASLSRLLAVAADCQVRSDEDSNSALQYYRMVEDRYLSGLLPDQTPFTKDSNVSFVYLRKSTGGTMTDGVLTRGADFSIDVPPTFLREVGVQSSQVINLKASSVRVPLYAAAVASIEVETAGTYESFSYLPSAPVPVPVSNLSTPAVLLLPLLNSSVQYACVRAKAQVEVADCTVVEANATAVLLSTRELGRLSVVPVQSRFPSVAPLPHAADAACSEYYGPSFAALGLVQAVAIAAVFLWWKAPLLENAEQGNTKFSDLSSTGKTLPDTHNRIAKAVIPEAQQLADFEEETPRTAELKEVKEPFIAGHYLLATVHLKSQRNLFSVFLALLSHLTFVGVFVYIDAAALKSALCGALMTTAVSLALTGLHSLGETTRNRVLQRSVAVGSGVLALTCFALVLLLNQAVCGQRAKEWTIDFLYCAAAEVTVLETLVAVFRFGFLKFANRARTR